MQLTYFDSNEIKERTLAQAEKQLSAYRARVLDIVEEGVMSEPESALAAHLDEESLKEAYAATSHFKKPKLVILIGIGGSSLGTEAVHAALGEKGARLLVLSSIAPHEMEAAIETAVKHKRASDLAVCIVSKSGATTETLANAEVLLSTLRKKFGTAIEKQVVYIGDKGNELLQKGKKRGGHTVPMPEAIGGRYSVFTPVGLVPLALLGHDIEEMLQGLSDATSDHYEEAVAESAARLYLYMKKGYRHLNFFAFTTRLEKLGQWYRQLTAESLGKETDVHKKPVTLGVVPTISTPVELHSTGQLYFSGFPGVYTDFVHFDESDPDFELGKAPKLATKLKGHSLQEIVSAIYGGVITAYQKRELPYRATNLDEELPYSLGLFMGMRMLETMYVATLMEVNPFDQPNVELYKQQTRKILGL